MLNKNFLEKIAERLNKEREEVFKKIIDLKKPEKSSDNPDLDDIGHDAAEDILEDSLKSVYDDILEKIDNALLRIKSGTYGKCPTCGASVPEEFLMEEPWAEHCSACRGK